VLALGIAGLGVMNIMLVSVEERTPEIGIRLAVGARGRDVRAQFLAEAATLCLGGSTIGWVVGLVGAEVVSQRIGVGVIPPVSAFLVSGITCVAIGLLFGLYPAERAARLDPIVALRSE
jgi:putative ABC transport system permease protein